MLVAIIMRIIQSAIFRALCAIVVGAMLVKYREDMVTWLTISIGILFFISGIISCIAYFIQKRRYLDMKKEGITITDSTGKTVKTSSPSFPLVGIGSAVLGLVFAFRPSVFIEFGSYIFAFIILLGTVTQFADLITASRYGKIKWYFWVMPIILFVLAITVIVHPSFIASATFFFCGWSMILYGIVEIINAFKVHRVKKNIDTIHNA